MRELTIGVMGTSSKTDEKRYPIHPAHLMRIPEKLRKKMIFEQGYSAAFNMNDEEIAALTGGIATRSDILTQLGTVIIAKPVLADLIAKFTTVEWNHEVIQSEIKQVVTTHNIKFPKLAMPLRVMVTGETHTPSIAAVLELLGREETLKRLNKRLASFPE